KLIDEIRNTSDFASRVDKMHKAEDMLMDTWAVIPIYYYNDIYMQKGNVDGVTVTVYGMKYFLYATKK
ncbi:peptide/nickel transport system substrate-binding protein/oligopeptide transport system substrate-binding protein, partial [Lachnospiraceae bacterium C10]